MTDATAELELLVTQRSLTDAQLLAAADAAADFRISPYPHHEFPSSRIPTHWADPGAPL